MKITRDNYEVFFIDYLEGNLEEMLVNEFIEFLQQNPDLKMELEMAEPIKIEGENLYYEGKANLYKQKYDLEKEFDQTAVARLEGDLSANELADFESYLTAHPEKQKDVALFEKTKLKADETLVFRKKNKLYHQSAGRAVLLWTTRVAAILALAFLVYQFADNFSRTNRSPENQVATSEPFSETIKETPESSEPATKAWSTQEPVAENEKATSEVKKAKPKSQPAKSHRDPIAANTEHKKLAHAEMPVEMPEKIKSLSASLSVQQPDVSLAHIKITKPETQVNRTDERLLADVVKEKTGLDNLSLNTVAKAGLNLVSNISKEKFNYETNTNGEITELSFDSRLLAFTIPTKNE